jgi:hypothetical protein
LVTSPLMSLILYFLIMSGFETREQAGTLPT